MVLVPELTLLLLSGLIQVVYSQNVRLVDGRNSFEGRVEVFSGGRWQAVCDDGWDLNDANTVCAELNYGYAISAVTGSGFGDGNDRETIRYNCGSFDDELSDCPTTTLSSCSNSVGVICSNIVFKDGSLRLADSGSSITGGRLEIHKDGSWGTICDLGWDSNDALVACKQLGFANVEAEQSGSFPTGSGSILLSSVECNGDETSIISCPNSGFGNTPGCSHSQDVRIICSTTPPSDSSGVGGIVGGVVSSISAILVVVVVAVVVTICIKKKKKNTVPTCNTNGRRSPEARHQPGGYEESTQQQNLPDSQPPQIQPLPYPANNPPPFNPDASYPPSAPPSGAWGPNFDEEPPPYPIHL